MSSGRENQSQRQKNLKKNVVLTGFGLFRDHESNPSWEAIKDDRLKIERPGVNIIKKQIDVAYEEVNKAVEYLWNTYDPLLVVHIGLAAHETAIRIESQARHGPYIHYDTRQQAPHEDLRVYSNDDEGSLEEKTIKHNYTCKPCSFDCSSTCFDVDNICKRLNQASKENKLALEFKKSQDAGLFVCEYLYKQSLIICDRTIFLHVPDTKEFTLEDITNALKHAIEILIDEAISMYT